MVHSFIELYKPLHHKKAMILEAGGKLVTYNNLFSKQNMSFHIARKTRDSYMEINN